MNWALRPITRTSLRTCDPSIKEVDMKFEREWGNKQIGTTNNGNWTTKYGEDLVKKQFEIDNIPIWKPKNINGLQPDWETPDHIIEVKTRNWTTSGTAGEKVLGVPYKYSDVPKLYGKPLLIICVAYQEWELTHIDKYKIFGSGVSENKLKQLKLWKGMGIHYVPFSKLYKGLDRNNDNDEHPQVGGGQETASE